MVIQCTMQPPIEGLLTLTGTEPTTFQNFASKLAGLLVHVATPGIKSLNNEDSMCHL